jgi:starch phosphorylase
MASLTPRFSANRAVGEYTEQHYLPAAATYRERAADKGAVGRNIVNWEHALKEKWGALRCGAVKVQTNAAQHIFEAEVFLNGLDPSAVRVELYANGIDGSGPVREEMTRVRPLAGADSGYAYVAQVPATRRVTDYTARVIPHCDGVAIPLEDSRIQWQR